MLLGSSRGGYRWITLLSASAAVGYGCFSSEVLTRFMEAWNPSDEQLTCAEQPITELQPLTSDISWEPSSMCPTSTVTVQLKNETLFLRGGDF